MKVNPNLHLKIQLLPRSKHIHCLSVLKTIPVNAVYESNDCLFWDPYKTFKFIVGLRAEIRIFES
jgi:hypothetical protein